MREVKPVNGWRCVWLLLVLFHLVASSRTHREHKVHNIVLYPGKHSWCKTTPIKQVVAWPGCVAKEIDNNVCVGACFSYTIPQTQPSAPGDVISPYCDSCQASEVSWMDVTLDCDPDESETKLLELAKDQQTSEEQNSTRPFVQMKKKVQIIANCSCSSCSNGGGHHHGHGGGGHGHHQQHLLHHHESETPELVHQQQDVPELMGLVKEIQFRQNSRHAGPHPHFRVNNHTLHQLLVDSNIPEGQIGHQLGVKADSEEEPEVSDDEVEHTSPSAEPPPETTFNAAAESLSLPKSAFEHPGGHHPATHLEVAHEKLHPAHEGTEVSYHENLINPEPIQESEHADQSKGQFS
ncbi:uncharacterized protein LOC135935504 [Cloeon dipterum]|uniref:uncharacterized protein LOC135935504 n=1 Tax=Cloeon dipterum TaxID=197152 RepID=UPI0032201348